MRDCSGELRRIKPTKKKKCCTEPVKVSLTLPVPIIRDKTGILSAWIKKSWPGAKVRIKKKKL